MSELNCRFCGSDNLSNIRVTLKKTSKNQLKPELSYENIKASIGSIGRKKEFETSYITKFCILCRNIDAINEINPTPPLKAHTSDSEKWIVIPHTLSTHLKTIEYDDDEIVNLLHSIKNCLEKIYDSWSVNGLNPCKSKHIGKKIPILLKNGVEIMCWVIVESVKNKTYLRLSYGGNKITCPEN